MPSPSFVHDNVTKMEQVGYDGVVMSIPSANQIFSQTPVSYQQLASELAPLASTKFTTMTHNFVIMYRGDPGPWDGDWTTPLANVANLAKAAKEVGLEGILYDNEDYTGTNSAYWPTAAPNLTLPQAVQVVHNRGVQVGDAIASQWPTATVITMFGPWASDPATAQAITAMPYPNVDWANQLLGPFFVGMVDAAQKSQMTMADGGELYSVRSAAEYEQFYNWNKTGMAQTGTQIPPALAPAYPSLVKVGFTVYDQPAYGRDMNPAIWQSTLTNALKRTDRYVIAYTELFDWWGSGWPGTPVPADWLAATKAAKEAGGATGPSNLAPVAATSPATTSSSTTSSTSSTTSTSTTTAPTTTTTAALRRSTTGTPPSNAPLQPTPSPNTPSPGTPGSANFVQSPWCIQTHDEYVGLGAEALFLPYHPECQLAGAS